MNQFNKHTYNMSAEDFLAAITQNSPAYVTLVDSEGVIKFVNRTSKNLSKKKVLGQPIFNFLANNQESERLKKSFDLARRNRQANVVENIAITKDGTNTYWETRISPVIDEDTVTGFLLFSNNISARKADLLEQRAIFDLSQDLLCILKFDGYFSRVNPAFTKKLGYSESELLSIPIVDLIHPEDKAATEAAFGAITKESQSLNGFENRYLTKTGDSLTIQWAGSIDKGNKRIIGIGRDISQHRALEQQLAQSQKMDAIGQLAGGVAHDFNNLLMAISANAELGAQSSDPTELHRRFTEIQSATKRAAQLTQKLLTFSRNQPLDKKPLDLNELVTKFLRLLERVLPETIELEFTPSSEPATISGDQAQIEQVLMNLCVNSRDSMPDGGKIKISVQLETQSSGNSTLSLVLLRVEDSGKGIKKEYLARIFDPFFTTKVEGKGTGLGLSTAFGIIDKHDGTIEVSRTSAQGTVFQITLPLQDSFSEPKFSSKETPALGGLESILYAEDEEMVAKITQETLQRAGYTVIRVNDGEQVIERLKNSNNIDLVFMDIVMPKTGGPEAAAIIKESLPTLPILFASGYSPESYSNLLNEYSVLNKPYRADMLLKEIRKLLDNIKADN